MHSVGVYSDYVSVTYAYDFVMNGTAAKMESLKIYM
jgi:hypothetical protein